MRRCTIPCKPLIFPAAIGLVLLLVTAGTVRGASTSELMGTVTDSSGGALPGVVISVLASGSPEPIVAFTDAEGAFRIADLAPGPATVSFELAGFDPGEPRTIDLRAGQVTILRSTLQLAGLHESVNVAARLPAPPPPVLRPIPQPLPETAPLPPHDPRSICGPRRAADDAVTVAHVTAHRFDTGRLLYAERDVVIIDAGAGSGVQAGQNLVARRRFTVDGENSGRPAAVAEHTAGVVQVVQVDADTSIGAVVYSCDEIVAGDSLQPFVPEPEWTAEPSGTPEFDRPARVLFADQGQMIGTPRRLMVIDRGTEEGTRPGQRVTIFRRNTRGRTRIAHVAQAIVVAARPDSATIRIESATDVVYAGDEVAVQRTPSSLVSSEASAQERR